MGAISFYTLLTVRTKKKIFQFLKSVKINITTTNSKIPKHEQWTGMCFVVIEASFFIFSKRKIVLRIITALYQDFST